MTIEVRQLVIKSTVLAAGESLPEQAPKLDIDSVKAEILAECREMIQILANDKRER